MTGKGVDLKREGGIIVGVFIKQGVRTSLPIVVIHYCMPYYIEKINENPRQKYAT